MDIASHAHFVDSTLTRRSVTRQTDATLQMGGSTPFLLFTGCLNVAMDKFLIGFIFP
jgi:hypothetical protein